MNEIWLRTNARATRIFAALVATVALLLIAFAILSLRADWRVVAVLTAMTGLGFALMAAFVWQARKNPRIARSGGDLLLYVADQKPVRVPLGVVEAFLLGTAPFPSREATQRQSRTLVIKLSERADEWGRHETRPALAQWCSHYVTIQGAWCEPLSVDLVQSLNERLAAAQREQLAGAR